jgi:hypothetical protein
VSVISDVEALAQAHWRRQRMALFLETLQPTADMRILDIGGLPELWNLAARDLNVTLVNLPRAFRRRPAQELADFSLIEADICRNPEIAQGYDLIFSNSVLEHVGSARRQAAFAEAVSYGSAYWIQVPAPSFPIEPHCHQWFWWLRSPRARARQIRRWRRVTNPWRGLQMASTRPIARADLRALFPDAEILTERMAGWPKSYCAFRTG